MSQAGGKVITKKVKGGNLKLCKKNGKWIAGEIKNLRKKEVKGGSMKFYFYGSTEKAAKKKADTFVKQLLKFDNEEKAINITKIAFKVFESSPEFPIPAGYRVQYVCEYSYMAKQ